MELIALDRGLGRHIFYLTPWQRQQQSKYNSIGQAFCIMSLSLCKTSLCITLLRIVQGSNRVFMKWLLYTILVLVNVVNIIIVVTLFEQCQPTSKVWNSAILGKCWAFPIELDLAVLQGGMFFARDNVPVGPRLILYSCLGFYRLPPLWPSSPSYTTFKYWEAE